MDKNKMIEEKCKEYNTEVNNKIDEMLENKIPVVEIKKEIKKMHDNLINKMRKQL